MDRVSAPRKENRRDSLRTEENRVLTYRSVYTSFMILPTFALAALTAHQCAAIEY